MTYTDFEQLTPNEFEKEINNKKCLAIGNINKCRAKITDENRNSVHLIRTNDFDTDSIICAVIE